MTTRITELVEDPDSLRHRLAALEDRLGITYQDDAEIIRLSEVAAERRTGASSRHRTPVSREDQAEIARLSKLSAEMRGSTEAPEPATEEKADPTDQAEIARLAKLAKERR